MQEYEQSNDRAFTEVWADATATPPYILVLLSVASGECKIYDPAENYKTVFKARSYEEAKLWLLEDEYDRVGRLGG